MKVFLTGATGFIGTIRAVACSVPFWTLMEAQDEKTRKKLGWNPAGPGLIADLDQAKF